MEAPPVDSQLLRDIAKLRVGTPIRSAVERVLRGSPESSDLDTLLEPVKRFRFRERNRLAVVVRLLPMAARTQEERERVGRALCHTMGRRQWAGAWWLGANAFAVSLAFILLGPVMGVGSGASIGMSIGLFGLWVLIGAIQQSVALDKLHAKCGDALGLLALPNTLSEMLRLLTLTDRMMFTIHLSRRDRALIRALKPISDAIESDMDLQLSGTILALLTTLLKRDAELAGAALKLLELAGDGRFAQEVNRCAAKHPDPAIRAEAARIGDYLARLRTLETAPIRLVRAADAPDGELLRPSSAPTGDSDTLVRPADPDPPLPP